MKDKCDSSYLAEAERRDRQRRPAALLAEAENYSTTQREAYEAGLLKMLIGIGVLLLLGSALGWLLTRNIAAPIVRLRNTMAELRHCALQHSPDSGSCQCVAIHRYNYLKVNEVISSLTVDRVGRA